MVNLKRTHYGMILLVITLFVASVAISVYAGIGLRVAFLDSALDSLQVSYNLIVFSYASNPLVLVAKLLDALIFPILTVLLATWFFEFINNINLRERLVLSKINKLEDHVIVAPYNNLGRAILSELKKSGIKSVVIVQSKKELFQLYRENELAIRGDLRDLQTFEIARVGKARGVVACGKDDIENALIAITAKTANPSAKIISRANKEENIKGLQSAGAYRILIPERSAGEEMGKEISKRVLSKPGVKSLNLPAP